MKTEAQHPNFDEAVRTLRTDPAAMPWNERFDLARQVSDALQVGESNRQLVTLARLLACDPKWEVRAAIADTLLFVPDPAFAELASALAADANAYVARAANRAMTRNGNTIKRNGRARRTIDEITTMRRAIETKFGRPAAQQAQRMCDRYSQILVGSMVHDLLSLHTAIITDCLSLMEEVGRRRRVPMRLRANLDLTERAIQDMRAYTKPLQLDHSCECLADLVQRALEVARQNALRQRIDPDTVAIEIHVPERISLEVSQHLVVIALANVLTNAFEAIAVESRPGQIQISAKVSSGAAEITIRDNGHGILENEIMDPEFMLPGRRNKSKRFSTGYGLPIAMRNLAAHGGTMQLKSRFKEGTTVTIRLPLAWEGSNQR